MSSNPAVIACGKDEWTKVATAVTSGVVHKISTRPPKYLQTYRLTGEAAPTDDDEGALLFPPGVYQESILADTEIDVYIYAVGKDGAVRVDL